MTKGGNASAFGQADPTDGREPFDWKSKYDDPLAIKEIRREAVYLGVLLFAMPTVMTVLWLEYPKHLLHLSDEKYRPILKYGFSWAAGTLGGVLFDLKWLTIPSREACGIWTGDSGAFSHLTYQAACLFLYWRWLLPVVFGFSTAKRLNLSRW